MSHHKTERENKMNNFNIHNVTKITKRTKIDTRYTCVELTITNDKGVDFELNLFLNSEANVELVEELVPDDNRYHK